MAEFVLLELLVNFMDPCMEMVEMEVIVDVGDMLLQAKEVEAVDGKVIEVAVEVMVKIKDVIQLVVVVEEVEVVQLINVMEMDLRI